MELVAAMAGAEDVLAVVVAPVDVEVNSPLAEHIKLIPTSARVYILRFPLKLPSNCMN
jgi:hypothetical protein